MTTAVSEAVEVSVAVAVAEVVVADDTKRDVVNRGSCTHVSPEEALM
jgi:hypothetical protein